MQNQLYKKKCNDDMDFYTLKVSGHLNFFTLTLEASPVPQIVKIALFGSEVVSITTRIAE